MTVPFQLAMLARGYYASRRSYIALSLPINESDLEDFVGAVGESRTSIDRCFNRLSEQLR